LASVLEREGNKMKRLLIGTTLFGAMLLGLVIVVPVPTLAQVDVVVSVPSPIVFAAPPEVIVIPSMSMLSLI
jgi:hypothetical protein